MQIRVERFLAITAVLASTAVLAIGCVSEEESSGAGGKGGAGATGGTGGTAGSAGGAGEAGSGATGGDAGNAGAGGSAGGDAGPECVGDTPLNADAGVEGFDFCANLPYVNATCADAGTESGLPLGLEVCYHMSWYGRLGVTEALAGCLEGITVTDACSQAHDDAVQNCINSVWPLACTTGPITVADAGTLDVCQEIADDCPQITKADCLAAVSPFNADGQYEIAACYAIPVGTCQEDFEACVLPF
jgi:hypothetical protein